MKDSYKAARSSPVNQDPRLLWVVVSLKKQGSSSPATDPNNLPPNVKLLSGIEQLKGESSTAVQKSIQAGGTMEGFFDPAVKEVIERLGLYQPVTLPLGGGVGKLFKVGPQPINTQLQAFGNAARTEFGPKWELRFQIQFLFPK